MAAEPHEPYHVYQNRLDTLAELESTGEISTADYDAITTFLSAFDESDATVPLPTGVDGRGRKFKPKKPNTLRSYASELSVVAQDIEITDTSADEINRWTTEQKQAGKSNSTLRGYEMSLKSFFRYHDELGVDPADIVTHSQGGNGWDHRDILTEEERADIRDAAEQPRDLAVFDLLVFCGLRATALRTLRVGDIDTENREFYFNADADGLKNVYQIESPRPLLKSYKAVKDWLKYHPTGEDDHYLITSDSKFATPDPSKPVANSTINRILKRLFDKAGVDKPDHPHMMRHNFVTHAKAEGVPDDTIKFLLGHSPDSRIFETTYSHLSGKDHTRRAMESLGLIDEDAEEGDSYTPDVCDVCGNVPRPGAKLCDACGNIFHPSAMSAQQGVQQDLGALRMMAKLGVIDVSTEEVDEMKGDPEAVQEFIETRAARS